MVTYKTEKVSDRVTRIFGICTELMYLVEGEDKAALIDTGSGFGSLKQTVEKLTDKPVIVLLTHGHVDHAMGAGEFETVYMNHNDDDIFKKHGQSSIRWDSLRMSEEYVEVVSSDYIETADAGRFYPLKEGDRFDLGGCTLNTYACYGHTRGSMVFLLEEERILFLGDACNSRTFMFQDYSLTISEYEKNLKELKEKTDGKYDTVFSFHGDGKLTKTVIEEVLEVCEDIRLGRADDIPFRFLGSPGLLAKAVDAFDQRIDGKCGNVVYSKERI